MLWPLNLDPLVKILDIKVLFSRSMATGTLFDEAGVWRASSRLTIIIYSERVFVL